LEKEEGQIARSHADYLESKFEKMMKSVLELIEKAEIRDLKPQNIQSAIEKAEILKDANEKFEKSKEFLSRLEEKILK